MSHPRKRRKVQSRSLNSAPSISTPDEDSTSFDVDEFRREFARYYIDWRPSKVLVEIWSHPMMPPTKWHWSFRHRPNPAPKALPLSELENMFITATMKGLPSAEGPPTDRTSLLHMSMSLSGNGKVAHRAHTKDEVIEKIVEKYPKKDLLRFLQGSVAASSPSRLAEMKKYSKASFDSAFIRLYYFGSTFGERRSEEMRCLEETDLNDLEFVLCGISVPMEVMREIFQFFQSDYALITSVGLLSWDFYVLVLLTWNVPVILNKRILHSVPELVLQVASEIGVVFCGGVKQISNFLTNDEIAFAFQRLRKLDKMNFVALSFGCGISFSFSDTSRCEKLLSGFLPRMVDAFKKQFRLAPLLHLRKISFPFLNVSLFMEDHLFPSYNRLRFFSSQINKKKAFRAFRLAGVCPNVEVVEWPFHLAWCDGLLRCRSLKIDCRCMKQPGGDSQKLLSQIVRLELEHSHQAPNLRELCPDLTALSSEYDPYLFPLIPWGNLEELCVLGSSSFSVLPSSLPVSSLRRLEFRPDCVFAVSPSTQLAVVSASQYLTRLTLCGTPGMGGGVFTPVLSLIPSLELFQLHCFHGRGCDVSFQLLVKHCGRDGVNFRPIHYHSHASHTVAS